jgi:hypothetical protein
MMTIEVFTRRSTIDAEELGRRLLTELIAEESAPKTPTGCAASRTARCRSWA